MIGDDEVAIGVSWKGNYWARSYSGRKILHITNDGDAVNAITKEIDQSNVDFKMLEIYA